MLPIVLATCAGFGLGMTVGILLGKRRGWTEALTATWDALMRARTLQDARENVRDLMHWRLGS